MVEAREREVGAVLGQRLLRGAGLQDFLETMPGRATEDDEVDQAVRAQAVRAVHRYARGYADREQAGDTGVGDTLGEREDLTMTRTGEDGRSVTDTLGRMAGGSGGRDSHRSINE